MEENEIIERAKNGDSKAFNYLYKKYKLAVNVYFIENLKNKSLAEDLTQETFMKLYKNLRRFDDSKYKFYTFLIANAKQVYIEYFRKVSTNQGKFDNGVTSMNELIENEGEPLDIDKELLAEDIKVLRELISGLCTSQRVALEMIYFENKSYKQVAARLGKTELSIKSIVHRAKQNLRKNIKEKYPEMDERMSKKYIAKMIIMIAIGISAVTGLAYATYRIYNDVILNNKYTLSELREDVPESASIITREQALEKINYYLDVLGEDKVSIDEIKLVRNIKSGEIYWRMKNKKCIVQIKSNNGEFVAYTNSNLHENKILDSTTIDKLYDKLNLSKDYELCKDEKNEISRTIEYAKRYDDIYNRNECVKISIFGENIYFISVLDYPYEDREILISKERALEIARENDIEVKTIELSIENINESTDYFDTIYEEIDYNTSSDEIMKNINIDVRKVWKIVDKNNLKVLIDVEDGEIFYVSSMYEKQVGE